jgi:DNA-binding PadR family transcriptional regulator
MKLLEEKGRMYGYEITQKVKEITKGELNITEGALYPALHKLEADGLLDVEVEKVDNRLKFLMSYELFEKQMGGLGKNNLSRFTIIPKETKLRLAEIDKSLSSANLSDKERKALEQEKNSLESSLDTNLAQSFEKIKGAMKVLKDEKEKGIAINEEFIQKILDRTEVKGKNLEIQEKHDATANRKVIMSLYAEIYEFLYGKYAKTINVDPLYKEGLQYLQDEGNRSTGQVHAPFQVLSFDLEGIWVRFLTDEEIATRNQSTLDCPACNRCFLIVTSARH